MVLTHQTQMDDRVLHPTSPLAGICADMKASTRWDSHLGGSDQNLAVAGN
jgi:hypothetical protein